MVRKALAFALSLGFGFPLAAAADDVDLKFEGGIGVIPVSSGVGTAATATVVNRNIVRGVQPPGQIWVISRLSARVKLDDSRISVDGRGLLLGGGNNIGLNANQSVRATLICGSATPTLHDTSLVPLEPNGDFRIDDLLTPSPPMPCDSPVLLIRNPAGSWFAGGILKR